MESRVKEFGKVDLCSGIIVSVGRDSETGKGGVHVHLQNPYAEGAVSTFMVGPNERETFVNIFANEMYAEKLKALGARNIWKNSQGATMARMPYELFEDAFLVTADGARRDDGTVVEARKTLEMTVRRAKISHGLIGGQIDPDAEPARKGPGL